MRLVEFLERYVFVRKCVACRERLGYDERKEAFCAPCRIRFERAKVGFCQSCSRAMIECECMPNKLSRVGMLSLRKLCEYTPEHRAQPEQQLIYFLKMNKNARVASFAAEQLSFRVNELLSVNEVSKDEIVLTHIPRSRTALAKYGFDQAELVCRALCDLTGIEFLPLVKRSDVRAGQQKKLNFAQRAENARGSFELDDKAVNFLDGRAVIVFDDVVTSGASMAEAVRLLHKKGVKTVFGLCIATTSKR